MGPIGLAHRAWQRTWNASYQDFFRHYAYPLTDELYVLWDDDPEQWRPINHSCDRMPG
jgi:hypothetical protein